MNFDNAYIALVSDILATGLRASNRTGIDTLYKLGILLEFNLAEGFPILTTKPIAWKSAFAEQLGFIRGYDNAADFRTLGTKVWDANANKNDTWLNNFHRKGVDDLGRIYGVQGRKWRTDSKGYSVDQVTKVYEDLCAGIDNRREIVSYWNPGELNMMALPSCHMFYQFGLREDKLDLFVYVRSNDVGLGMPFNVTQYAWLLAIMAQITGHNFGKLLYFAFNYHIYVNHIEALTEQIKREPRKQPTLIIHPRCSDLHFLEQTTIPLEQWCWFNNYDPHPKLSHPMKMAI
jgi:thymidylate synthase